MYSPLLYDLLLAHHSEPLLLLKDFIDTSYI